jgi:hypothetical protein
MKVTVNGLNTLVSTIFFRNLSKLVLAVDEDESSGEFEAATAFALSSTGKLRHLELTGLKHVDPQVFRNMAVSCRKLENLNTDCLLTTPDVIDIFVAHTSTLKSLPIYNIEITDELIEAQSECKNLESFPHTYYPLFTQLKNFQNLVWLYLDCQVNFSPELLERALTPGVLPVLVVLKIKTEKEEEKIFSVIPKAFPNLKAIVVTSSNTKRNIEVFRQFISDIKIRQLTVSLRSWRHNNISELFTDIEGKSLDLTFLRFNHATYHRREARKLFNQIPTLQGISHVSCLYVRASEAIKKVKGLEEYSLGSYDQINILEM